MPSLRDVAHDGVLCTFSKRLTPDRGKLAAGLLSSSQPGGLPSWVSPLAFGRIAYLKGTAPRDFRLRVFSMNQSPPRPLVSD
jgi:hypothetical protein